MSCILLDNSSIKKYYNGSTEGTKTYKVGVNEDSQFVVDLNSLTEDEIQIDFVFDKSHIKADVIGIYTLTNDQKLTTKLRAVHNVSNTSCLINIKGALYDKAFSYHQGEIFIGEKAFDTESYLSDHTLLLSSDSKTVSMPNLRIYNNNVKASHGASVGSVNEEKIYYLQSRGFEKNDAINILVSGYFESTFNEITDQNVANVIRQKMLTPQE